MILLGVDTLKADDSEQAYADEFCSEREKCASLSQGDEKKSSRRNLERRNRESQLKLCRESNKIIEIENRAFTLSGYEYYLAEKLKAAHGPRLNRSDRRRIENEAREIANNVFCPHYANTNDNDIFIARLLSTARVISRHENFLGPVNPVPLIRGLFRGNRYDGRPTETMALSFADGFRLWLHDMDSRLDEDDNQTVQFISYREENGQILIDENSFTKETSRILGIIPGMPGPHQVAAGLSRDPEDAAKVLKQVIAKLQEIGKTDPEYAKEVIHTANFIADILQRVRIHDSEEYHKLVDNIFVSILGQSNNNAVLEKVPHAFSSLAEKLSRDILNDIIDQQNISLTDSDALESFIGHTLGIKSDLSSSIDNRLAFFPGAEIYGNTYIGTLQECLECALTFRAMFTCLNQFSNTYQNRAFKWVIKNARIDFDQDGTQNSHIGERIVNTGLQSMANLYFDIGLPLDQGDHEVLLEDVTGTNERLNFLYQQRIRTIISEAEEFSRHHNQDQILNTIIGYRVQNDHILHQLQNLFALNGGLKNSIEVIEELLLEIFEVTTEDIQNTSNEEMRELKIKIRNEIINFSKHITVNTIPTIITGLISTLNQDTPLVEHFLDNFNEAQLLLYRGAISLTRMEGVGANKIISLMAEKIRKSLENAFKLNDCLDDDQYNLIANYLTRIVTVDISKVFEDFYLITRTKENHRNRRTESERIKQNEERNNLLNQLNHDILFWFFLRKGTPLATSLETLSQEYAPDANYGEIVDNFISERLKDLADDSLNFATKELLECSLRSHEKEILDRFPEMPLSLRDDLNQSFQSLSRHKDLITDQFLSQLSHNIVSQESSLDVLSQINHIFMKTINEAVFNSQNQEIFDELEIIINNVILALIHKLFKNDDEVGNEINQIIATNNSSHVKLEAVYKVLQDSSSPLFKVIAKTLLNISSHKEGLITELSELGDFTSLGEIGISIDTLIRSRLYTIIKNNRDHSKDIVSYYINKEIDALTARNLLSGNSATRRDLIEFTHKNIDQLVGDLQVITHKNFSLNNLFDFVQEVAINNLTKDIDSIKELLKIIAEDLILTIRDTYLADLTPDITGDSTLDGLRQIIVHSYDLIEKHLRESVYSAIDSINERELAGSFEDLNQFLGKKIHLMLEEYFNHDKDHLSHDHEITTLSLSYQLYAKRILQHKLNTADQSSLALDNLIEAHLNIMNQSIIPRLSNYLQSPLVRDVDFTAFLLDEIVTNTINSGSYSNLLIDAAKEQGTHIINNLSESLSLKPEQVDELKSILEEALFRLGHSELFAEIRPENYHGLEDLLELIQLRAIDFINDDFLKNEKIVDSLSAFIGRLIYVDLPNVNPQHDTRGHRFGNRLPATAYPVIPSRTALQDSVKETLKNFAIKKQSLDNYILNLPLQTSLHVAPLKSYLLELVHFYINCNEIYEGKVPFPNACNKGPYGEEIHPNLIEILDILRVIARAKWYDANGNILDCNNSLRFVLDENFIEEILSKLINFHSNNPLQAVASLISRDDELESQGLPSLLNCYVTGLIPDFANTSTSVMGHFLEVTLENILSTDLRNSIQHIFRPENVQEILEVYTATNIRRMKDDLISYFSDPLRQENESFSEIVLDHVLRIANYDITHALFIDPKYRLDFVLMITDVFNNQPISMNAKRERLKYIFDTFPQCFEGTHAPINQALIPLMLLVQEEIAEKLPGHIFPHAEGRRITDEDHLRYLSTHFFTTAHNIQWYVDHINQIPTLLETILSSPTHCAVTGQFLGPSTVFYNTFKLPQYRVTAKNLSAPILRLRSQINAFNVAGNDLEALRDHLIADYQDRKSQINDNDPDYFGKVREIQRSIREELVDELSKIQKKHRLSRDQMELIQCVFRDLFR